MSIAEGKELDAMRFLLVGILSLAWQKENKIFYIEFQGSSNDMQTVVFDHSEALDEFANNLKKLMSANIRKVGIVSETEKHQTFSNADPLHIIKVRYARGEITKEQYEEMKRTLS